MSYRGVIFDLDGTLADTLEDIAGSVNRTLKIFGYPVHPVSDYKLLVGRGLDNLVKQSLPEQYREDNIISQCLSAMIEDYTSNCLISTRLYPGIPELILELQHKNLFLAVFSNKAEPLTLKIVKHLLPDVPFIRISGARKDFPKKPDPAGALLISNQAGIAPENIIYVGDSDVDMMTARRAGMFAVGVAWGFRSIEELQLNGADKIIFHPGELLGVVE
jgi:phosphoglycolate phosphatase